jgi:hypothetical protein
MTQIGRALHMVSAPVLGAADAPSVTIGTTWPLNLPTDHARRGTPNTSTAFQVDGPFDATQTPVLIATGASPLSERVYQRTLLPTADAAGCSCTCLFQATDPEWIDLATAGSPVKMTCATDRLHVKMMLSPVTEIMVVVPCRATAVRAEKGRCRREATSMNKVLDTVLSLLLVTLTSTVWESGTFRRHQPDCYQTPGD